MSDALKVTDSQRPKAEEQAVMEKMPPVQIYTKFDLLSLKTSLHQSLQSFRKTVSLASVFKIFVHWNPLLLLDPGLKCCHSSEQGRKDGSLLFLSQLLVTLFVRLGCVLWANKRSEKQSALLWSIKDAKETLGQGSEIFIQAAAKSEQTGMNHLEQNGTQSGRRISGVGQWVDARMDEEKARWKQN